MYKHNYSLKIFKTSDGDFYIDVPQLKGCIAQADTFEAVVELINDAIECWIETAKELGRDVPEPDIYKV